MHADLVTRRRVLMLTYRRYLQADRAWTVALDAIKGWYPAASRPGAWVIGNPGSPIRRLHERRERALLQLEAARLKLDAARQRLAARRGKTRGSRILLVSCLGS